ncbi:MAG: hypothetical protein VX642_09615 [Bdellovibrionota bacterium]|nr:hypothetical protein [Bdellovibrionota bacterium]
MKTGNGIFKILLLAFFTYHFEAVASSSTTSGTPCATGEQECTVTENGYSVTYTLTDTGTWAMKVNTASLDTSNSESTGDTSNDNLGRDNQNLVNTNSNEENASDETPSAEVLESLDSCSSSYTYAQKLCDIENSPITTVVLTILPGFASSSSDDVAESCKKAADLTKGTTAISAAITAACWQAKNSCVSSCEAEELSGSTASVEVDGKPMTSNTMLNSCKGMTVNITKMLSSISQGISAMAQAQSCDDLVSDDDLYACYDADKMTDPEYCPSIACDLTTYPQNSGHAACAAYTTTTTYDYSVCTGSNAQYNVACAPCYSSTPPSTCPSDTTSSTTTYGDEYYDALYSDSYDSDGLGNSLSTDDFFSSDFDGFDGETASQASLASGGSVGSASLGSSSTSSDSSGLSGSSASANDENVDTDILGRLSGTSGGSSGSSFSGGYAEGAGSAWKNNARKIGSATESSEIDLQKLIGDLSKKTQVRDTAALSSSEKLAGAGITSSNGLSNFQKVTRMINKQRTSLEE